MGDSASPSSFLLIYQKDGAFLSGNRDAEACSASEEEYNAYIADSLRRESANFSGSQSFRLEPSTSRSWFRGARLLIRNSILFIRKKLDLKFTTACLSLTYFDRFLSMQPIGCGQLFAVWALAMASLSLAAKFKENKWPDLLGFQSEGCLTENELILLEAFEWDLNLTTPFTYLHYFIHKFCGECKPEESLSRDAELIMDLAGEINIMDHRPSVIAAATILVGIYDQLTVEDLQLKMSRIPFSGSLENEHIFSCFNLMQNIKKLEAKSVQNSAKKRKLKTHWPVAENFCTVHCLVGVIKNSSSPLAVRLKRRLPFITNHICRRLPFSHHGDLTSASTFP